MIYIDSREIIKGTMKKIIILFCVLTAATISFAGWERTYGGALKDNALDIIPALDGGYLVTGKTESFGFGSYDIYVIKTDSLGFSAIDESSIAMPSVFQLSAFPNPFNSSISISLTCHSRENGNPEIEIFDIAGRCVARIPPAPLIKGGVERSETGGLYVWQPDESLASGVYLVRARFDWGDESVTKRIVYLR